MATTKTTSARKPAGSHPAHEAPWDHANPKGPDEHKHLSPQAKAAAKRRAKRAGRHYPNLVDNMAAAQGKA